MDPFDAIAWTVPQNGWRQFFVGGGETLRGIYGYWQSPGGNCPGNRSCDVPDNDQATTAMRNLVEHIWPATPGQAASQIHDAWQTANETAGLSDEWSMIEDCNATTDTFSASTSAVGDAYLSGTLCFTGPYTGGIVRAPSAVQAQTFTLQPMSLTPRTVDVASLVQKAQTNLPVGTVSTFDNGTFRRYVSSTGLTATYYYGLSGAVEYVGHSTDSTVAFAEADALNAAQQFVSQSYGMPSDAVLANVVPVYRINASTGSRTLVQYEFIWRHTGNVLGGDAIRVNVFDLHRVSSTCSQWDYVDVWDARIQDYITKRECVAWTENVSDTPDVSFSYYLWREPTSLRQVLVAGRTTGGPSIDAYTASMSLPDSKSVTSYTSGYWTPGPYDTDQTEEPAWLFTTTGGDVLAVDAYTGALLGSGQ